MKIVKFLKSYEVIRISNFYINEIFTYNLNLIRLKLLRKFKTKVKINCHKNCCQIDTI